MELSCQEISTSNFIFIPFCAASFNIISAACSFHAIIFVLLSGKILKVAVKFLQATFFCVNISIKDLLVLYCLMLKLTQKTINL